MKVTIAKNGKGYLDVYVRRTRRDESRVMPKLDVAVDQLAEALEEAVTENRSLWPDERK